MRKFNVTVNGKSYQVEIDEVGSSQPSFSYAPVQPAPSPAPQAPTPIQPAPISASGPVAGEPIVAPMPGTILDVKFAEGQQVKSGDVLFILEAMKMENEITSPKDGVIAKVHIGKGTIVNSGDTVITIA